MGKLLKVALLIVTILIFAVACGSGEEAQKPELQMGEIEFEQIDLNSAKFDGLYADADFADWFEQNCKEKGVFSYDLGEEERCILLCAGEKSTGGYSIGKITVTGTEENIKITAELNVPADGSPVTQSLTYPNALISIPLDERELVFDGFEEIKETVKQELKQDTGRYVGQIDPHSVEIKISGVPDELAAKAFQLDDAIRDDFEEKHGLKSGDEVKFTYFVDEHQRPVLKEISKL